MLKKNENSLYSVTGRNEKAVYFAFEMMFGGNFVACVEPTATSLAPDGSSPSSSWSCSLSSPLPLVMKLGSRTLLPRLFSLSMRSWANDLRPCSRGASSSPPPLSSESTLRDPLPSRACESSPTASRSPPSSPYAPRALAFRGPLMRSLRSAIRDGGGEDAGVGSTVWARRPAAAADEGVDVDDGGAGRGSEKGSSSCMSSSRSESESASARYSAGGMPVLGRGGCAHSACVAWRVRVAWPLGTR